MRTAEEIVKDVFDKADFRSEISQLYLVAINQARKEALEEAAEKAKSEWVRYGTNMGHAVEKQSILLLINELK